MITTAFIMNILNIIFSIILIYYSTHWIMTKNLKSQSKYVIDKLSDMPVPSCVINAYTNKIESANSDFYNMFNIKYNNVTNTSDIDILDTGLFNNYSEYYEIKNKEYDNKTKYFVSRVKQKDDSIRIFKISYNNIKISYKKFILISVVEKTNIIDYIKRLSIFTKIADDDKDAIIVVNIDKSEKSIPIIKYVNKSISNVTGYNSEELKNKPLSVLFETNVNDETLTKLNYNINNLIDTELEYQYIKKDGSICWIKCNITPIARKSIINNLNNMDINKSVEDIKIINEEDYDIYITLYQTDITNLKEKIISNNKNLENKECLMITNKLIDSIFSNPNINLDDILKLIGDITKSNRVYLFNIYNDKNTKKLKLYKKWEDEYTGDTTQLLELFNGVSFEDIGFFEMYSKFLMRVPHYCTIDEIKNPIATEILNYNRIKSAISFPIYKKNELIGFIAMDDLNEKNRIWDNQIQNVIKQIVINIENII